MSIVGLAPALREEFAQMLTDYFIRDLQSNIPVDIIRQKLLPHIESYVEKGIVRADLILSSDKPAGFSIYQIDTPDSDWCKRPGWGFIREFYIVPDCRGRGFGRSLAAHTEQQLRTMAPQGLYLTTENPTFWEKCGWVRTDEICSNGLEILTRKIPEVSL